MKSFRAERSEPDGAAEQSHRRHQSGSTTPSETSDGVPHFALHLSCVLRPIAELRADRSVNAGVASAGVGAIPDASAPFVGVGSLALSSSRPSEPLLSPYGTGASPSQQQQHKRWSVVPAPSLAVSTTAAQSRTSIRALQKRSHNARCFYCCLSLLFHFTDFVLTTRIQSHQLHFAAFRAQSLAYNISNCACRMVFVSSGNTPLLISSTVPFNKHQAEQSVKRHRSACNRISTIQLTLLLVFTVHCSASTSHQCKRNTSCLLHTVLAC